MLKNLKYLSAISALMLITGTFQAQADVQPGQSMTHMKTSVGLASLLESASVILYVQGGATAGVIGDSISDEKSQFVFHIPITGSKNGVEHTGSNIVLFNTANNLQVQLRNPVIDLAKGVVTATIPQASNQSMSVLTITNASEIKAKSVTDRKTRIRSTTYAGANLVLAPGIAGAIVSLLGLPEGSLADGGAFGTADVTLKRVVKRG